MEVDDASLVTPPCGLEYGFVPVVMYQAMEAAAGCVQVTAATASWPTSGDGDSGNGGAAPDTGDDDRDRGTSKDDPASSLGSTAGHSVWALVVMVIATMFGHAPWHL